MYTPGERLDIFNYYACSYFTKTGFSVCYAFLIFTNKMAAMNGSVSQSLPLNITTT